MPILGFFIFTSYFKGDGFLWPSVKLTKNQKKNLKYAEL